MWAQQKPLCFLCHAILSGSFRALPARLAPRFLPSFLSIEVLTSGAASLLAMPQLSLTTNVPVDAIAAADILRDCSRALARIIGKPESYVTVSLSGSVPTSFAASEEPAAYGELMSIGGLGPGVNGKLSAALAEILETKLSIASNRFYIKFDDVQGYNVGFNGSTF